MTIDDATKRAIQAIEDMSGPKCHARDYLDSLREVADFLEVCIDAAKDDVRRAEQDDE